MRIEYFWSKVCRRADDGLAERLFADDASISEIAKFDLNDAEYVDSKFDDVFRDVLTTFLSIVGRRE